MTPTILIILLSGHCRPQFRAEYDAALRSYQTAHALWNNERDEATLTAGLDANSAALVRRALALAEA